MSLCLHHPGCYIASGTWTQSRLPSFELQEICRDVTPQRLHIAHMQRGSHGLDLHHRLGITRMKAEIEILEKNFEYVRYTVPLTFPSLQSTLLPSLISFPAPVSLSILDISSKIHSADWPCWGSSRCLTMSSCRGTSSLASISCRTLDIWSWTFDRPGGTVRTVRRMFCE